MHLILKQKVSIYKRNGWIWCGKTFFGLGLKNKDFVYFRGGEEREGGQQTRIHLK